MTLGIRTWVSHSATRIASRRAEKGGPVSPNPLQEALGRQVSAWRNACPRARAPADAPTRARQGLRRGADVSQSARCRSHVQEHLPVRIPLDPVRHPAARTQSSEHTPALPSARHSCAPWWLVLATLGWPSYLYGHLQLSASQQPDAAHQSPSQPHSSEAPLVPRPPERPRLTGWLLRGVLQVLNRLQAAADLGQEGYEWAHQAHYGQRHPVVRA